ncbi:CLIP-associated protein [Hibiscus syriacus]|uniref:CLIP-associated protein n=1 Tax=Hibiscus syriacus TaxID=106335 RepID=A0A6A2Z1J9_HIBSY|nr:CLIP-associated protein [Hibiscus syriacus]
MLLNCKVARVLPRIADCAKNDRSAVLRAKCCEYALLILEHWPDEPEIQRSVDLYEDLIRCFMFPTLWSKFLHITQIINEEDGGVHRRHASPSVRDRNVKMSITSQSPASSHLPGYQTSAIVAMDRTSTLSSGTPVTSGLNISQPKPLGKEVNKFGSSAGVDSPSSRDPPFPAVVPASSRLTSALGLDSTTSTVGKSSNQNGGLVMSDIITQIQASKDSGKLSYRTNVTTESLPPFTSHSAKRASGRQELGSFEDSSDIREARRFINPHIDRQYLNTPYRDVNSRDLQNNCIPNFQRPLSRKHVDGRVSAGRIKSFDDSQLSLGEMSSYVEGPASLGEALSEGLTPSSDWSARVAAFTYLWSLLQQGPKGIQEVDQNFEKVMKLFLHHLDDPHHKVAQAALSTLADIIPSCRKPFESCMERILPHVFSRLIDPKELVRQPCSMTLEIVGKTYSIDSLLPALLRSLDEQRSPKAKLAVIEFAISSFNKHAMNSEGSGNIGILKLWLAKLTPLAHDKKTKLKYVAITCIISVYSKFDPTAVLNFILSLSVEEQNFLRRALKQYTPRIEVDLINYLQNRKERQRSKSSYDPSDVVGTSSEEGYIGVSKKSFSLGRYSAGSADSEGGRKWGSTLESTRTTSNIDLATSDETQENSYQNLETSSNTNVFPSKIKDWSYIETTEGVAHNETPSELDLNHLKPAGIKISSMPDTGPSIPQLLHLICNGNDESSTVNKHDALHQINEISVANDLSVWSKYANQILTAVLEVLDDSDSSIRELVLSLIIEMLKNQKGVMEDSVEIVIEKLLHVMKDTVPKVSNEAEHCLNIVLSQYDPFRCLSVIVPLLVTEDEKTLVICINCLTKLVGRLSQEELTAQLPSFLPALFEAFGNQSADVRKTVAFCLVDIYIMLGKRFCHTWRGLTAHS